MPRRPLMVRAALLRRSCDGVAAATESLLRRNRYCDGAASGAGRADQRWHHSTRDDQCQLDPGRVLRHLLHPPNLDRRARSQAEGRPALSHGKAGVLPGQDAAISTRQH